MSGSGGGRAEERYQSIFVDQSVPGSSIGWQYFFIPVILLPFVKTLTCCFDSNCYRKDVYHWQVHPIFAISLEHKNLG